jgi:hypothetical protein
MFDLSNKKLGLSLWTSPIESNPLKVYMAWLKKTGQRSIFSHADYATTLHKELSLVENLILAIGEGSIEGNYFEKETYLNLKLEQEGLKPLASWFKNPRRKASELNPQEAFVASVCHALLRPTEKIFIDMNTVKLDPLCFGQIQKILKEKSLTRHITVRLFDKSSWSAGFDEEFILSTQISRVA